MTWLIDFFTKTALGISIAKLGAIIAAVVVILFGAKQAGKRAQQIEQLKMNQRAIRRTNAIDVEIDHLPSGAALDELRQDWSR